jgi:hypothetical protein
MSSAITYLTIDPTCPRCGARPRLRTCLGCGAKALLTDCGHMPQPRPIAIGRGGFNYCVDCSDEQGDTVPS